MADGKPADRRNPSAEGRVTEVLRGPPRALTKKSKESPVSTSDIIIGEVLGTAMLILLGGGVVAAISFKRSKAYDAGWVAITFGWGFGVLTGAYIAAGVSGAHLNPAVTLGLAVQGGTAWSDVPVYLAAELVG